MIVKILVVNYSSAFLKVFLKYYSRVFLLVICYELLNE